MSSVLTPSGWIVKDDVVDERNPLPRLTQEEIDALNADIAAGSNHYPTGTQVVRVTDETVFRKEGVGAAGAFVPAGTAGLKSDLAKFSGSGLVGHDDTTVADRLNAVNLADYTALRAYTGKAKAFYITGYLGTAAPSGTAGWFTTDDSDTTSSDNGGTTIVSSNGKRRKRVYSGDVDVSWFGAVWDGVTNNNTALAAGKAVADSVGAYLYIPPKAGSLYYTNTITLAAGQKMRGAGWGNNPLGSGSTNSSILKYGGTAEAIKITGHQAEAIGLSLTDGPNTATHAVRVLSDSGNLIEGARVDVYVNGFTGAGAWAFSAEATDGAIAYGEFKVRARSCSNYFKIQDNNDGRAAPFGFANSNRFLLVCSGGETGASAPGYALYVDGGNDNNILPGSVLEPWETQNNHLKVLRGSLHGKLRIEGSSMPSTRLLVDIAAAAQVSGLEFDPSTAYALNRSRSSTMKNKGAKSAQPQNPNQNLYKNPHWSQNKDGSIADWTITGAGVATEVIEPDFITGFRTLKVTVPAGIACTIAQPVSVTNTAFDFVSHGFWVKYDISTYPGGSANVSMFATTGTAGSGLHTGDGTYQYLGQAIQWNTGSPTNFQNRLNLTGGSGSTVFYVTCPMLCFGNELPNVAPQQYEGVKRMVVLDLATIHNSANNEITLPASCDAFLITSTVGAKTITRVNNTSTFFPLNKEITLLFNSTSSGSTISTASGTITARANITTDQYSVVRLIHDKAGLWRVSGNY